MPSGQAAKASGKGRALGSAFMTQRITSLFSAFLYHSAIRPEGRGSNIADASRCSGRVVFISLVIDCPFSLSLSTNQLVRLSQPAQLTKPRACFEILGSRMARAAVGRNERSETVIQDSGTGQAEKLHSGKLL